MCYLTNVWLLKREYYFAHIILFFNNLDYFLGGSVIFPGYDRSFFFPKRGRILDRSAIFSGYEIWEDRSIFFLPRGWESGCTIALKKTCSSTFTKFSTVENLRFWLSLGRKLWEAPQQTYIHGEVFFSVDFWEFPEFGH